MRFFLRSINILKSKKGFSLVEVVIAAGITGVVAVAIMKLIEMQTAGSKRAFQDQTINQTLNEVNTYFAREATCTETMVADGEVDLEEEFSRELVIYSSPGQARYKAGTKIEQVEIISIKAAANDATIFGEKSVFDIWIKFLRTGKKATTTVKRLRVIGKVKENGVVENCESYDNTAAVEMRRMICEDDFGGTINANGRCVYGDGAEGNILKETACEMMGGSYNDSTGRCGVLNVDDYAILGKANATANSICEPSNRGAIRFNLNADVNSLEVCNGEVWGSFGAGKAVSNELITYINKKHTCADIIDQLNIKGGNSVNLGFTVVNRSMYFSKAGNWMLVVGLNECASLNNKPSTAYGYIPRDSYGKAVKDFYQVTAGD